MCKHSPSITLLRVFLVDQSFVDIFFYSSRILFLCDRLGMERGTLIKSLNSLKIFFGTEIYLGLFMLKFKVLLCVCV